MHYSDTVPHFWERTAKENIRAALEAIREQNPVGRILLIADNDGGHHAHLIQQRANELGIEFVILPSYSPNFNAIEPFWESLKRKISSEIFENKEYFIRFVINVFSYISHILSSKIYRLKDSFLMYKSYDNHFRQQTGCDVQDSASCALGSVNSMCFGARNSARLLADHSFFTLSWDNRISIESTEENQALLSPH